MPSAKTSPNPERLLPNEPRTYTSEEIASIFFSDAKSAVLYDGRMTIVSESDNFVLPESQLSRNEESYLAGMALDTAVLSTGNQPLLIKIFISDDGYKLNYIVDNGINGLPKRNEILLYIEADEDLLSGKVMRVRSGDDVKINNKPLRSIIRSQLKLEDGDVDNLLLSAGKGGKDIIDSLQTIVLGNFQSSEIVYGWLSYNFGEAITLVDRLLIDEEFWNPELKNDKSEPKNKFDPKNDKSNTRHDTAIKGLESLLNDVKSYIAKFDQTVIKRLKSLNKQIADRILFVFNLLKSFINQLSAIIRKIVELLREFTQIHLSFIIGFWNGIVDMISGLLFIVKIIFDGGKVGSQAAIAVTQFSKDKPRQRAILELLDNVIDKFKKIEFDKVSDWLLKRIGIAEPKDDHSIILLELLKKVEKTKKKLSKKEKKTREVIIKGLKKKIGEAMSINLYQLAYYIGYIVTLFIPVTWIANLLGKIPKAGRFLSSSLKWVDDLTTKVLGKMLGPAIKGIKQASQPFVALLRVLNQRLKGGTKALLKNIDEIIAIIKKWLDEVFHNWSRTVSISKPRYAVFYRGTTYKKRVGSEALEFVHDLGDGLYLAESKEQALEYAKDRTLEYKGGIRSSTGEDGIVYIIELDDTSFGKVFDFFHNKSLKNEWESYLREINQEILMKTYAGGPQHYYNALLEWLKKKGHGIEDFDVIIGPDYSYRGMVDNVRGRRSQVCIRNEELRKKILEKMGVWEDGLDIQ